MGHSSVDTGPFHESLALSGASAPGDARRLVRRLVGAGELRETLELLVSELVTNAVSYTYGAVQMSFCSDGDQIRIEVSDASTLLPTVREPSLEGGRGLRFVEALADRWGVEGRLDGKMVWFEVAARKDAP